MNIFVKLYQKVPRHPWYVGPLVFIAAGFVFNLPAILATGIAMLLMMGSVFPWVKAFGLGKGYTLASIHVFLLVNYYQQYALAQFRPTQDICTAFNVIPGFGDLAIKLLGWMDFGSFSVAGLLCGLGGLVFIAIIITALAMAGRSTIGSAQHGFNMSDMSQPIIAFVYFVGTVAIIGGLIFALTQIRF